MKRHIQRKLTRIVVTALTLALTGAFFWVSETMVSKADPLPTTGKPAILYFQNLQHTIVNAIDQAQKSVTLIIYSLNDPQVIQALKNKANAGIPVTVVVDPKASYKIERKLGSKVRVIKRISDGLMHNKVLVIDGMQTWMGSANMTGDSLKMHQNLMMAIQSKEIADCVLYKAHLMEDDLDREETPCLHQNFSIDGQEVEVWFLPDDKGAVNRLQELIRGAQKSIRIAMYTWTRFDLAQAVIRAANRGVKVEVILDKSSVQSTTNKVAKLLKEKGVPVFVNQRQGLLHHKMMEIDDQILVNGSANWTKAAFSQNDDCFMILHHLNLEQQTELNALWTHLKQEVKPYE